LSLHALFPNGKESWIVIQNPEEAPDRHQNLTSSFIGHDQPLHKNGCRLASYKYW